MHEFIKIGLVEDQQLFRDGITALIASWQDTRVNFESPNGYSVIEKLNRLDPNQLPNVMLVDLSLPPDEYREFSGLDVTRALKNDYPKIKVLILSVHEDPYIISQLIENGADGYLLKDSDPEEVHEAIVAVYERGSYINNRTLQAIQGRLTGNVKRKKDFENLSPREVEVLRLICQQMTTNEIGDKLFISSKTVNGHRTNLLQKTGSKNATGLVMYAIKHRIVELI